MQDFTEKDDVTLQILSSVAANETVTQRTLSGQLGIALGMTNLYLKRCIKKGLIKVSQAPANRFKYYLTAEGFLEKSRLTAEYLSQSLNLFRYGRNETVDLMTRCMANGWRNVLLVGANDFAEIAILGTNEVDVRVGVLPLAPIEADSYCGVPVVEPAQAGSGWDAAIICDYARADDAYSLAQAYFPTERILIPSIMKPHYNVVQPAVAEDEEAAP